MAGFIYEWVEAKRAANLAKHGIDFITIHRFDWDDVVFIPDRRARYGERRFLVYGMLSCRLHAVTFTPRGAMRRIISLRKANRREQALYKNRSPDR